MEYIDHATDENVVVHACPASFEPELKIFLSGEVVPRNPKIYKCGDFGSKVDDALSAIRFFLAPGMFAQRYGSGVIICYHADMESHFKILVNVGNLISAYLENIS